MADEQPRQREVEEQAQAAIDALEVALHLLRERGDPPRRLWPWASQQLRTAATAAMLVGLRCLPSTRVCSIRRRWSIGSETLDSLCRDPARSESRQLIRQGWVPIVRLGPLGSRPARARVKGAVGSGARGVARRGRGLGRGVDRRHARPQGDARRPGRDRGRRPRPGPRQEPVPELPALRRARRGSVTFTGPDGLDNVISRVTGGKPSDIDGTLRSGCRGRTSTS